MNENGQTGLVGIVVASYNHAEFLWCSAWIRSLRRRNTLISRLSSSTVLDEQ